MAGKVNYSSKLSVARRASQATASFIFTTLFFIMSCWNRPLRSIFLCSMFPSLYQYVKIVQCRVHELIQISRLSGQECLCSVSSGYLESTFLPVCFLFVCNSYHSLVDFQFVTKLDSISLKDI